MSSIPYLWLMAVFMCNVYILMQCSQNYMTVKTVCIIQLIEIKKDKYAEEWEDEYRVKVTVSAPMYPYIRPVKFSAFDRRGDIYVTYDTVERFVEYFNPMNMKEHACTVRPRVNSIHRIKGIIATVPPKGLTFTIIATIFVGIDNICILLVIYYMRRREIRSQEMA